MCLARRPSLCSIARLARCRLRLPSRFASAANAPMAGCCPCARRLGPPLPFRWHWVWFWPCCSARIWLCLLCWGRLWRCRLGWRGEVATRKTFAIAKARQLKTEKNSKRIVKRPQRRKRLAADLNIPTLPPACSGLLRPPPVCGNAAESMPTSCTCLSGVMMPLGSRR